MDKCQTAFLERPPKLDPAGRADIEEELVGFSKLLAFQNNVRRICEPIRDAHRREGHFDNEPLVQVASDDGSVRECLSGGLAIRTRQSARSQLHPAVPAHDDDAGIVQ